jgi:hypothetical protein
LGGSASEAGRWALQASIKSPTFPRHTRREEPSLKRAFRAQGRRRWPSSSFLRADGSRGRELLMTLKKPCRATVNLPTRGAVVCGVTAPAR